MFAYQKPNPSNKHVFYVAPTEPHITADHQHHHHGMKKIESMVLDKVKSVNRCSKCRNWAIWIRSIRDHCLLIRWRVSSPMQITNISIPNIRISLRTTTKHWPPMIYIANTIPAKIKSNTIQMQILKLKRNRFRVLSRMGRIAKI